MILGTIKRNCERKSSMSLWSTSNVQKRNWKSKPFALKIFATSHLFAKIDTCPKCHLQKTDVAIFAINANRSKLLNFSMSVFSTCDQKQRLSAQTSQVVRNRRTNKPAGYHRHIFRPPSLLQMAFERMKAFFQVISSNFVIFPNLKCFWFLQKNSIQVEKKTLWYNIICYAFYSKFASFSDILKKSSIFWKNIHFFKKKQISYVLRNLTILVAFYGKFAVIWW